MKNSFRIFFLFVVLLIFFTWTTGVSFYIHECNSSHKKEIIVYPEILNKSASCCCVAGVGANIPTFEPFSSYNEPECCKNTHIYLKASFTGFPTFYQFSPEVLQKIVPSDFLSVRQNEKLNGVAFIASRVDHPPPRSGKILIHFIQQVKIPAPVS
jgi:hypothetical protein